MNSDPKIAAQEVLEGLKKAAEALDALGMTRPELTLVHCLPVEVQRELAKLQPGSETRKQNNSDAEGFGVIESVDFYLCQGRVRAHVQSFIRLTVTE